MANRRVEIPNLDDIIRRHLDGESILSLAKEFGICEATIRYRFKERGVKARSRNSYPANVAAAHAARRGQVESMELLEKRAIGRQRRGDGISHLEAELASLLRSSGIHHTPQLAVGPYNIDLAIERGSVAVEVLGGGYSARTRARLPERRKYLLDRGWHLIEVRKIRGPGFSGFSGANEKIVSFLDFARRNPSAPREHWVIRSDGETLSPSGGYTDQTA